MAWTGLKLTVNGRKALNEAQIEKKLNFKSIVIGDGETPANFNTLQSLVHPLYEITDLIVEITDTGCNITGSFPMVDYDYYFREIGLMASTDNGEILYIYDNCGDDAQYIVSTTGVELNQKRIRLSLMISDVDEITVSSPAIEYITRDEFILLEENKLSIDGDLSETTINFTEANVLENIESGEKTDTIFGKISKLFSEFIDHIIVKASSGVLGHVKLSSSSAVTDSTGLALPVTEKNASISGTLANQITSKMNKSETLIITKSLSYNYTIPSKERLQLRVASAASVCPSGYTLIAKNIETVGSSNVQASFGTNEILTLYNYASTSISGTAYVRYTYAKTTNIT